MKEKKKRGRKPKGGKLIKTPNIKKHDFESVSNIILHLKCKEYMPDFKNCHEYNPIVNTIESFDINNQKKYYKYNMDKKNRKEKKQKENQIIWDKLKDLSKQLNINNINKESSCCFWCTEKFNNSPIYLPKYKRNKYLYVYGCFCSTGCAAAYLFKEDIDPSVLWERYALLNNMYKKIFNYKKNIKPSADPHYLLDKFYGNITIEEYRKLNNNNNNNKTIIFTDKPLTNITPEIHYDLEEYTNSNFKHTKYNLQNSVKKQQILTEKFNF